jgi:hypothetical protein
MAANYEEQQEFAKWVLNVRDDNVPAIAKVSVDPDWIKISFHMRLLIEDCNLRGLIQTIYLDHQPHSGDAMYFMQCSILAPKNIDVDEVNNAILESLSKELHTYLNVDSLVSTEEGANVVARVSMDSLYPVDFLNILQFSNITNHKLELKVGMPILLLRNFNQSIRLCNGTRLIVKHSYDILGAGMLWKPKEARILTNFIDQPVNIGKHSCTKNVLTRCFTKNFHEF